MVVISIYFGQYVPDNSSLFKVETLHLSWLLEIHNEITTHDMAFLGFLWLLQMCTFIKV